MYCFFVLFFLNSNMAKNIVTWHVNIELYKKNINVSLSKNYNTKR